MSIWITVLAIAITVASVIYMITKLKKPTESSVQIPSILVPMRNFLKVQMLPMIPIIKQETMNIACDLFFIGYIHGVSDSWLTICENEMPRELATQNLVYAVFAGEDDAYTLAKSIYELNIMELQKAEALDGSLFYKGMMYGGQDVVEFVRDKTEPQSLLRHFHNTYLSKYE